MAPPFDPLHAPSHDDTLKDPHVIWGMLTSGAMVSLLCSTAGVIRWVSPSARPTLGVEPLSLVGTSVAELIRSSDRGALIDAFDEAMFASRAPKPLCAGITTANGLALWCDVEVVSLRHDSDEQLMVTLRDATSRVTAQRSLEQSEARFRSIVNEAPFGVGLQDRDGNFVYLNDRLKEILDTSASYLLASELRDHVHPADFAALTAITGSTWDAVADAQVFRVIRPTGEVRSVSVRILPQREHDASAPNLLWAVEDITARVEADQDQALVYSLMEASGDMVLVLDPTLRPLYLNPAARDYFGIDAAATLDERAEPLELQIQPSNALQDIARQMRRLQHWRGEGKLRSAAGEWQPFSAVIVPESNADGEVTRISAVLRDIAERRQFEERLEWESTHDPLTDLPNRALLTRRLTEAMERSAYEGSWVAVIFLDLDNFRIINESLGHRVGDKLLRQTAEKLKELVWTRDLVGRFGADEFAIVMEGLSSPDNAGELAERIRTEISGRVGMAEVELLMTTTAGVAVTDGRRGDASSVLRDANVALHEAKTKGRDRTEVFNGDLRARAVDRLTIETGLRRAIRRDEFRLFYQPQISLSTGQINGAEALIRWQHPDRGLLSPVEFVPIAEQSGLIIPIGAWVLEEACTTLARWAHELPRGQDFTMGINLSGKQLVNPSLIEDFKAILASTGANPSNIELEITESILLDDVDLSIDVLEKLKDLGLTLSLDDFGTGYSSLTYLRSFPIDVVKIDRSFVDGIGDDPENAAIVRSVIELANTLGLRCIAEGVETDSDLAALRELDCDTAQGYLIARPLSESDAHRLIAYDPTW